MRQKTLLTLAFMLVLASACASSVGPQQTAATMTQSDATYSGSTAQPAATNPSHGTTSPAAPQTMTASVQTTQPRMSRAQRALEVLRRSSLGRFGRFITGGRLGPANPTPATTTTTATPAAGPPRLVVGQPVDTGSGIKSSVTGTPVEPIPGVAHRSATAGGSLPAPTTLPSPTAVATGPVAPGTGRVVMGPAVDAETGIRSTVTGTPVEPIPGVTPASTPVQPSLATTSPAAAANVDTAGRASAASSPPSTVSVGTPPVNAIAPSEPVPGTKVSNAKASSAAVKIETAPDGTSVVTNVGEEEKPATKKAAKKATKKRN